MPESPDLAARVDRLETAMQEINDRLTRIESRRTLAQPAPAVSSPPPQPAPVEAADLSLDISLAGISMLALGGAYFLRALTEGSILPPLGGVIAGLLYAAFWVWKADRAARNGRRHAATFYVGTASVIAFPLAWETTTRFHILSPAAGAAVVAIMGLLLLWIAARDDSETIAWTANLGTLATAIGIIWTTRTLLPLMLAVGVVAVATLHISFTRNWNVLIWPGAIAADGIAFITLVGAAFRKNGYRPAVTAFALVGFAAMWLLVVAARRLRRHEDPSLFDAMQTAEVVIVGIGGATYLTAIHGEGRTLLGAMLPVAALGASIIAAARPGLTTFLRAWLFALAGLFVVFGSWLLLPTNAARGIAWAIFGAVAAEAGRRLPNVGLRVQSVVWSVAAMTIGGLLLAATGALIETDGKLITVSTSAFLIAALAFIAFQRIGSDAKWLRTILLAVATSGVFAVAVSLTATLTDQRMVLALIRTAILAALAGILALATRLTNTPEATTLARVVLVVGGIKLLAEDVRVGRAAMLVAAFVAYGCAMLLVAKSTARPTLKH